MTGHIIYVNCGILINLTRDPTQKFALRNTMKQISEMRDYIKLGKEANTERMCYLTPL